MSEDTVNAVRREGDWKVSFFKGKLHICLSGSGTFLNACHLLNVQSQFRSLSRLGEKGRKVHCTVGSSAWAHNEQTAMNGPSVPGPPMIWSLCSYAHPRPPQRANDTPAETACSGKTDSPALWKWLHRPLPVIFGVPPFPRHCQEHQVSHSPVTGHRGWFCEKVNPGQSFCLDSRSKSLLISFRHACHWITAVSGTSNNRYG